MYRYRFICVDDEDSIVYIDAANVFEACAFFVFSFVDISCFSSGDEAFAFAFSKHLAFDVDGSICRTYLSDELCAPSVYVPIQNEVI